MSQNIVPKDMNKSQIPEMHDQWLSQKSLTPPQNIPNGNLKNSQCARAQPYLVFHVASSTTQKGCLDMVNASLETFIEV